MKSELTFWKNEEDGKYYPNKHPYLEHMGKKTRIKTTRDSSCLGSGRTWIEPNVRIRTQTDGDSFERKMYQHGWQFQPVFRYPTIIWGFTQIED